MQSLALCPIVLAFVGSRASRRAVLVEEKEKPASATARPRMPSWESEATRAWLPKRRDCGRASFQTPPQISPMHQPPLPAMPASITHRTLPQSAILRGRDHSRSPSTAVCSHHPFASALP